MSEPVTSMVLQTKREELLAEIEGMTKAKFVDQRKANTYRYAFQEFARKHFKLTYKMLTENFPDEKMLALQDLVLERAKERIRWKKPLIVAVWAPFVPFAVGFIALCALFSLHQSDFPEYKIVKLHDWYKEKYGAWKPVDYSDR